jgi:hypothetical protein
MSDNTRHIEKKNSQDKRVKQNKKNNKKVTVTQLTTFVPLYSFINNITLKMATVAAKTFW